MWGEHYNRKAADLQAVQEEIALGIAFRPDGSVSRYGCGGTGRMRLGMRGESYWLESQEKPSSASTITTATMLPRTVMSVVSCRDCFA